MAAPRRPGRAQGAAWAPIVLFCAISLATCARSVQLDGSFAAAMRDLTCRSDLVLFPSSTQEVADEVARQVKAAAAAGTGLKIRASHRWFHSTAPFACPGTALGSFPDAANHAVPLPGLILAPSTSANGSTTSVALLLDNMSSVLAVDVGKRQMRVQAGMFATQLLQEASKHNLSVPLGSVPAFGDLTLGGVLVTGAHGTGHLTTSSLADILVELTWVDGRGAVHTDPRDSDAGKALVGGLGVAGIVTELLLQLQEPSHTQLQSYFTRSDAHLFDDVLSMLEESPHVLVVWRPDLKRYTAHVLSEVNTSVPVTGGIGELDLPKIVVQGLGKSIQAWQEDVHDLLPVLAAPVLVAVNEASIGHSFANLHSNGKRMVRGVGETNKMQAASCGHKCLWNLGSKIAMDDLHFSIELEQLPAWIADVRALIAADLWQHGFKRMRFMAPGYFWLRFGHGSDDFIAHTSGLKAPVHVQMSFMKSLANPLVPGKYAWVLEVLEQLTLCKYKGKPHWGKNHARSFQHPECRVRDSLPGWGRLEAFRAGSDPQGVFSPPLFEAMANGTAAAGSPGCAVRGECFCTSALHCAKGFVCAPSLAFPEYKACRLPGLL